MSYYPNSRFETEEEYRAAIPDPATGVTWGELLDKAEAARAKLNNAEEAEK